MTDTTDGGVEDAPDPGDASDDRPAPDGSSATRDRLVRAGHVLGLLVLILVVLPFVVYAVPGAVGAEHSYVVLSGSMEPTLEPGDVILVDDVPASAIEEGDVITFAASGETRTTTHRVIEVVERDGGVAFRTQGDNNEDPDQAPVEPSQVRGEVMSLNGALLVIPYIGFVIRFAATQTGFALLAIVPLALLVLSEIWNVVAATRTSSTATGDGGDPDAETTEPAAATDGADETEGVTIRVRELQLGLGILGAFLAYSVGVAYVTTAPWAIGVAAAVAASFALLGGLYFFGGGDADASGTTGGDAPDGVADSDGGAVGETSPGGPPAASDGGPPTAGVPESTDAGSADAGMPDATVASEESATPSDGDDAGRSSDAGADGSRSRSPADVAADDTENDDPAGRGDR